MCIHLAHAADNSCMQAASDVYSPVSGTVTAVNEDLSGDPELVRPQADLFCFSCPWVQNFPPSTTHVLTACVSGGRGVQINSDPHGDGWIMKIKLSDPSETDKLLDYDSYTKKTADH